MAFFWGGSEDTVQLLVNAIAGATFGRACNHAYNAAIGLPTANARPQMRHSFSAR